MSQWIYTFIWNMSEWSGIGLGKFAPYVFHQMIGGEKVAKRMDDGKNP